MKKKSYNLLLLVLTLLAGIFSFYITHLVEGKVEREFDSAGVTISPAQHGRIQSADPDFKMEAAKLSKAYISERRKLAQLFESSTSADDRILKQARKTIIANNDLLRRVVEHVLVVRKVLTDRQNRRLMNLCANIMRGRGGMGQLLGNERRSQGAGRGYQHRRGWGHGREGNGRGRGYGRGQGRGGQQRHRRGQLARQIELTPQQTETILRLDPTYQVESEQLSQEVMEQYEKLANLLEDIPSSREEVFSQVDRLIRTRLEQELRTVQHVITIRSHITPQQQKTLAGLCSSCRWD